MAPDIRINLRTANLRICRDLGRDTSCHTAKIYHTPSNLDPVILDTRQLI